MRLRGLKSTMQSLMPEKGKTKTKEQKVAAFLAGPSLNMGCGSGLFGGHVSERASVWIDPAPATNDLAIAQGAADPAALDDLFASIRGGGAGGAEPSSPPPWQGSREEFAGSHLGSLGSPGSPASAAAGASPGLPAPLGRRVVVGFSAAKLRHMAEQAKSGRAGPVRMQQLARTAGVSVLTGNRLRVSMTS